MLRKLIFSGIVAAVAVVASLSSGPPQPALADPGPAQTFNIDGIGCRGPGTAPSATGAIPLDCVGAQDRSVGANPVTYSVATIPAGNRNNAAGYSYSGPGWPTNVDADFGAGTCSDNQDNDADTLIDGADTDCQDPIPVADRQEGTKTGEVTVWLDLQCDGDADVLAGAGLAPPSHTPTRYYERTTNWGPGTGPFGADETYLDILVPPASIMDPKIRTRGDIDWAWILLVSSPSPIYFPLNLFRNVVPVNVISMEPVWSPTGTRASLVVSTAAPNSPTTTLACTDTTFGSLSVSDGGVTGGNPSAAGLYAGWGTNLSTEDFFDGTRNFVYTTTCHAIGDNGGVPWVDADSDCLATVANPGGPADADDSDPDQDGDLLLDGIEVAWGSCPNGTFQFTSGTHGFDFDCSTPADPADTDGDGRTDLEEMMGPTQFLSNPRLADTDGDGVNDGGLLVDATGDGVPDAPDFNGDGAADTSGQCTGATGTLAAPGICVHEAETNGSSHVRVGAVIVGTDIAPDAAGRDNCASISNPGQANFDLDSATEHGNGDLFGDACDGDVDEDFFLDLAESTFEWDPIGDGCDNDNDVFDSGEGFYSAANGTALSTTDPDTDGDGVLDGRECQLGSNPVNPASSPSPARATLGETDADKDGLVEGPGLVDRTEEKVFRTANISGAFPPHPDADFLTGNADNDSDDDGLPDGCEAFILGTNPVNNDTDGDGTFDFDEYTAYFLSTDPCNVKASDLEDLDGDGVKNNTDTCLTAPNPGAAQTTDTDLLIGNGKGIPGDDATSPSGGRTVDACDGDRDNDHIDGVIEALATACGGVTLDVHSPVDITYDDNNDGIMLNAGDDGPMWDDDGDGVINSMEPNCYGGQAVLIDRYLNTDGLDDDAVNDSDDDDDGLLDTWEVYKWGTSPLTWVSVTSRADSDGDGKNDCKEAADVNGDGVVDFVGDTIFYAKAALLPAASFGKDGDFDINGDSVIDFVGDVIQEAKFALISGLCK